MCITHLSNSNIFYIICISEGNNDKFEKYTPDTNITTV